MSGKKTEKKTRVLFVDSANDLPSQIAEHYAQQMFGDRYEVYSAGPKKDIVDCDLISVMYCAGEDMRRQHSKKFDDTEALPKDGQYDYVIFLQKPVFAVWATKTPWQGKQILADMGTREEFKCTDEVELAQCLTDMIDRVKAWISANMNDPAKLQALVTA